MRGVAVRCQFDDDGVPPQAVLQLFRGATGDDRTVVDDREPAGQPVGLFEVMGGEQHGHVLEPGHLLDLSPEFCACFRIEPGRRLVEEEHLRPVHQSDRDVEFARHAARIGLHLAVGGVIQPETVEQFRSASASIRGPQSLQAAGENEVLPAGVHGIGHGFLRDEADGFAHPGRMTCYVDPGDGRPPGVGFRQRRQDPDGRRLARAVGSEQPEDRS